LNLQREQAQIAGELQSAWQTVLRDMHLLKGENTAAFEREMADYLGVSHAIGVASGTDALILAVRAVGVESDDEVIVHANAFAAAVEAIHHCGARPVVVDVEADGFGPDLDALCAAITPRSKAIIAVHMYGYPLRTTAIEDLCTRYGLHLIEDGSHAHGASRDGRKVGAIGRAGCFSAGVVKNLGAYGDAGFLTTSDARLAQTVRLLQSHGQEKKNQHVLYGFNSRLDELQAAVLRIKLRRLDGRNRRRRDIAAFYRDRFRGLDLRVPEETAGAVDVYHQFVMRSAQRERLRVHLQAAGVESGVHYPLPLHRQAAWLRCYGESPRLPRAEQLAAELLSIPIFPDLTDSEVEYVAAAVRGFFGTAA
jgi:dTDP-4-amino-4,6-dideoxygalactose transaminase